MSADPKPAEPRQELLAPGDMPARAVLTPMDMLNRAVEQGANVETLDRLLTLYERWEATQARKGFEAAMSAAKAELPASIRKNKRVFFEPKDKSKPATDYKHETLDELVETVQPILAGHGLRIGFTPTSEVNAPITVTCTITHRDGHSISATLSAGADGSGSKNHLQGIGSAITYLSRYSLKALLGLAAATDDDGQASGDDSSSDVVDEGQLLKLRDLIEVVEADEQKFAAHMGVETIPALPAKRFEEAVRELKAFGAKRGKKV
jgi:hypothetical protein